MKRPFLPSSIVQIIKTRPVLDPFETNLGNYVISMDVSGTICVIRPKCMESAAAIRRVFHLSVLMNQMELRILGNLAE